MSKAYRELRSGKRIVPAQRHHFGDDGGGCSYLLHARRGVHLGDEVIEPLIGGLLSIAAWWGSWGAGAPNDLAGDEVILPLLREHLTPLRELWPGRRSEWVQTFPPD